MAIRSNVGNRDKLIDSNVALAEHPDIIETIEKELAVVAEYEDKMNALIKYFPKIFDNDKKELLTD